MKTKENKYHCNDDKIDALQVQRLGEDDYSIW